MNDAVELVFDNTKMQFVNASVMPDLQTANSLTFQFSNLEPFQSRSLSLTFNVFTPPTTNKDDVIITTATVSPEFGDNTPEDNTFELNQTVVGSFDPNDIIVLEGESILLEEADDYLHYVIRFQNTGTAEAINVNVKNIIDPNLDFLSMQIQGFSHDGYVEILDGIEANFIFDEINLPGSSQDEEASQGFIAYRIKPKQDAVVGDIFYNDAEIYFDFNPPILTNTVSTEIVESLSISDPEPQIVSLYPNPTREKVRLIAKQPMESIDVLDINGRMLKTFDSIESLSFDIDCSYLSQGIYVLMIKTGNRSVSKKLIKQ